MDENLCTFGIMGRADLKHFCSQSSLRGKKEKVDFGWVSCLLSQGQGFAGVEWKTIPIDFMSGKVVCICMVY